MEKKFEVVGFGAMNLDRLYRVERIAREGEHVPIKDVKEGAGGSAANTIAGLASLGAKTGFIGAVGEDAEGRVLLDDFRKKAVDIGGVSALRGRTGIIIGFVDDKGERTLYPYPGVNGMLSEKDIDQVYVDSAALLHVTSFVGEKQFRLQKKIVAKLPDSRVSFSPGDLYAKKGLEELMPFIKKSRVVFLNESEARELTGKGYVQAARVLVGEGAGAVAVTLGRKGCFVMDEEGSHHIPSRPVKAIDTTGAGDAFAAGFLFRTIKGDHCAQAARYANRIASLCVRKAGARTWMQCDRNAFKV